jgi:hypothetical protein
MEKSKKIELEIRIPVVVEYTVLEKTLDFPTQIDVERVLIQTERTGRKHNILSSLCESTLLLLEDDILAQLERA